MNNNQNIRKVTEELTENVKPLFTIQAILTYILFIVGLIGLGLINWATFEFEIHRLFDEAYWIENGIRVFSYGSIMMALSIYSLNKRKESDKEYLGNKSRINLFLRYYRPDKLKEYIVRENKERIKEEIIEKYKNKLAKLERKSDIEDEIQWKNFEKEIASSEDKWSVDAPTKYCKLKRKYLDRIYNADEYVLSEKVKYAKIYQEDLTERVKKGKRGVNRTPEGMYMSYGVLKTVVFMFLFSSLATSIALGLSDGGINAVIQTAITLFLAVIAAFRGTINGENTFEYNTKDKLKTQLHHLHSYGEYEAKQYNYNILENLNKKEQNNI